MNEITVTVYEDCETMKIENKNKTIFFGNYWDFAGPHDVIALIREIRCVHLNVVQSRECDI